MGKLRGFLEFQRELESVESPESRVNHYREFTTAPKEKHLREQGARCMDCGIPFCHSGCPLGNLIPDFNDAVYNGDWHRALDILHTTNNFPEFTGRLCPAPCESACVLGIIESPVSIELIEKYIVERGFKEDWITPNTPNERTGKSVAIVGSGPAGLAAAEQLNRAGHQVTVYEKSPKIGGLLRYGIPDFKLEKHIIDRRLALMEAAGITFLPNTEIGVTIPSTDLDNYDAVLLAVGSGQARRLPIPGENLRGVLQAMEFLSHSNAVVNGEEKAKADLWAHGKKVIIIGGGDTGSDCVGTSHRQGAESVTNFELLSMPPADRIDAHPWPFWPFTLKQSSSHKEGGTREWSVLTKEFIGDKEGKLKALKTVRVVWEKVGEKNQMKEVEGSEQLWPCDLALLALGFTGPENGLAQSLLLERDARGNYKTENYRTSNPKIFAAGDARRGQSLIVWAISEGREAARQIDLDLMGYSCLPSKDGIDLPLM